MPRDLPLGNGNLLVAFDSNYQIRDLYWPHVGQENHANGHPFRMGVSVSGVFRWLSDVDWQRELIEDRVTGLLVPNGNVGKLADGAAELLGSRDLARSLGRALRARALALFDPQELDENERRQYARLIEQGESG